MEFAYDLVGSYGWAIIIVTILMRLVVLPLDIKQRRSMRAQRLLQPKVEALKKKYANDQMALNRKTQELYKEAGVSPAAGCLPMIIQMFVFIAFFGAQRAIAYEQIESMFHLAEAGKELTFEGFLWVKNLWQADTFNIGISQINSSLIPTWQQLRAYESMVEGFSLVEDTYTTVMAPYIERFSDISNGLFILPLVATAASFLQSKLTMATQPQQQAGDSATPQMNMKVFQYMMPVMSLFICTTTSAAYALYWTTTSLIGVISYLIMNRIFNKQDEEAAVIEEEKKADRKMERKLPKI